MSCKEQLLLIEGLFEQVEELSAEHDAQGFDVEEEVFAGGNPAVLIEGQGSSRDEAMEVEVIQQDLVPGMEHSGKARGPSKVSAGEVCEGLRDSLKQDIEQDSLIDEDEAIEFVG